MFPICTGSAQHPFHKQWIKRIIQAWKFEAILKQINAKISQYIGRKATGIEKELQETPTHVFYPVYK